MEEESNYIAAYEQLYTALGDDADRLFSLSCDCSAGIKVTFIPVGSGNNNRDDIKNHLLHVAAELGLKPQRQAYMHYAPLMLI